MADPRAETGGSGRETILMLSRPLSDSHADNPAESDWLTLHALDLTALFRLRRARRGASVDDPAAPRVGEIISRLREDLPAGEVSPKNHRFT